MHEIENDFRRMGRPGQDAWATVWLGMLGQPLTSGATDTVSVRRSVFGLPFNEPYKDYRLGLVLSQRV